MSLSIELNHQPTRRSLDFVSPLLAYLVRADQRYRELMKLRNLDEAHLTDMGFFRRTGFLVG